MTIRLGIRLGGNLDGLSVGIGVVVKEYQCIMWPASSIGVCLISVDKAKGDMVR